MAVTITKQQEALQTLEDQVSSQASETGVEQAIDQASVLAARIATVKVELKELEGLYAEAMEPINDYVDAHYPADQSVVLAGHASTLQLGARTNKATVTDKVALYGSLESIQDGLFFELAGVGVGDIRKYLPPSDVEKVLTEEPTGARRAKFVGGSK